jgi:superfamily II DNA/RNA helicase
VDVFRVHEQVIGDYRAFTSGFVQPRDRRISTFIDEQFAEGVQWPDPWLSLNPSFATGGAIPELVDQGLLHPECSRIFRRKTDAHDTGRDPVILHRHQREAVQVAQSGKSYVLTTGTGSGKSLAYIVPIVDAVLRDRDTHGGRRPGVKAIVVYPMNALANSQVEEMKKFLQFGYSEGGEPVTFARYTGQESKDERRRILAEPPDILLTNYVMLDLVLTRPDERKQLIRAAQGMQFLALDELHTYRGRQGADVAMLIRRLRDQCASEDLQIVGTSATMASAGTIAERNAVVAKVATRLFGTEVTPERVIGETLVRGTADVDSSPQELATATQTAAQPHDRRPHDQFVTDPLAAWAESTFGLDVEPETSRLIRRTPTTVTEAATRLAETTGLDEATTTTALRAILKEGSAVLQPDIGRPVFAFRLHQFLSKGDTVYVSLEPEGSRHITGSYQVSVPDHPEKALLPLGFCRECGQEYLVVAKVDKGGQEVFVGRRDADASGGDAVTGYLYVSTDFPWPADPLVAGRLPSSWLVTDPETEQVDGILDSKKKYLPTKVQLLPDGTKTTDTDTLTAWFVSTPFAFCMRCGVSYEQVRGNDFGKLATLDAEGRSSAMTLLSASIVRSLREVPADQLPPSARKLLTFVDNRQDASLQAGHFNDFVQVSQLRGALHGALSAAGPDGLSHETIPTAVTAALQLAPKDFAQTPDAKFQAKADAERALRAVVEYQLYVDLQRGWRVTMPNLEQTGLLKMDYRDLAEVAADEESWEGAFLLDRVSPAQRAELCRILLDELRRARAIEVECLTEEGFDRVKKLSQRHLVEPWALPDSEMLVPVGIAIPRASKPGARRNLVAFGPRGAFGRFLRRAEAGLPGKVDVADSGKVIDDLFAVLTTAGLLSRRESAEGPELQINAGALRWRAGDGTSGAADPLRKAFVGEEEARVNPFFRDLYRDLSSRYAGMLAREHTAQVPQTARLEREADFRSGALPLLYCSPTMELGVDISDLNAVGLRNVPPTPANYAQRSGRAGRSGQQALVLTYCSTGNSHDSYWFRRSREMVAGSVIAPRLDLTNEDLVRSHVHAMWLAETDESMQSSITDLLEAGGDSPKLDLLPDLWSAVNAPDVSQRAQRTAERVLADLRTTWERDGLTPPWFSDTWVYDQVKHASASFDDAFDRWRTLYRTALSEYREQNQRAIATSATKWDREQAKRRAADARNQLTLLRNDDKDAGATDFYSYRYLASEGFLPGYSFPRLPLAAYIPARRGGKVDGDFLQRPRFVAISEFGPGSLIYHEGSRYEVTRVQLPRDPGETTSTGAVTEQAKRCEGCGYHHPVQVGTDRCELCDHPLGATQYGLLRLQTVFTRRRERISSDEEERRRSGFELEVSFRFADREGRSGRTSAQALVGGHPVLEVVHGDAAEMRIANVGRRRRKVPSERGFWLDLREGKWLSDKQAGDTTVDTAELDDAADVKHKEKVTPYVEDRRNLVVLRLVNPVPLTVAVTLRSALERALEAEFQLEDSELDSRALPDLDERGRMLLTEAAEGGAGVLGRLVEEPHILAAVARRAMLIIHYDPDTGADLDKAPNARERCEKGCYDCLLAYSNQYEHTLIDRHGIVPLLQQLMSATVVAGAGGRSRDDQQDWLAKLSDSGLERQFVDWLDERGHRLPDDAQRTVEAARARPDFVYEIAGNPVAVFVDGPHHDAEHQQVRDGAAAERLENEGWTVVRVGYEQQEWSDVTARFEWIFGKGVVRT